MRISVIVIGDTPESTMAIRCAVEECGLHPAKVVALTFGETRVQLTEEIIQACDAVLIEPLRSYLDGKRAEGIFLAREFWRSGVPVLLIGLDFRGNEVSKTFYWDLASGVPMDEALTAIISADLPEDEEIQRIEQAFQDLMNPPKNH